MAQFDEMPRQRGGEAVVAVAGPVTSLLVAAAIFGMARLVPLDSMPVWFTLTYLWQMNLVLAIFNLLPALPLDGGRILRSLLALRFRHTSATRFAGLISKVLAVGLGILGVLYSPFLILVAVFVWWAASQEVRQSHVTDALDGLHAQDLMTPQPTPSSRPG